MSAATGLSIDSALAASRLGPPLAVEAAHWVGPERVPEIVALYRSHYPQHAITATTVLPGVRHAIEAVRADGGRVLVVTAKNTAHAELHVRHLGLDVDAVVGDLWGARKGEALRAHGATVYVGDHVHDVAGARAAGAVSVSVATGPCTADELTGAGTDAVLPDLTGFADWWSAYILDTRLAALEARLRRLGDVVVAFSGGADSAFLLAAAVRALGPDRVLAATAVSASLPAAELAAARDFAANLGVRHLTPATHEMERAGYRANQGDRCAFCKAELVEVLDALAHESGAAVVLTGTNADDARAGFRPGIAAAAERGAVTPLLDVGMTKAQVRAASRGWQLPTWDKPAAACLSSRIAYGIEVTPARLSRVERAELAVRGVLASTGAAPSDLRVRDLGAVARIEVDQRLLGWLDTSPESAERLLVAVVDAGFEAASLDPAGFRSGSMNELLAEPQLYR